MDVLLGGDRVGVVGGYRVAVVEVAAMVISWLPLMPSCTAVTAWVLLTSLDPQVTLTSPLVSLPAWSKSARSCACPPGALVSVQV